MTNEELIQHLRAENDALKKSIEKLNTPLEEDGLSLAMKRINEVANQLTKHAELIRPALEQLNKTK